MIIISIYGILQFAIESQRYYNFDEKTYMSQSEINYQFINSECDHKQSSIYNYDLINYEQSFLVASEKELQQLKFHSPCLQINLQNTVINIKSFYDLINIKQRFELINAIQKFNYINGISPVIFIKNVEYLFNQPEQCEICEEIYKIYSQNSVTIVMMTDDYKIKKQLFQRFKQMQELTIDEQFNIKLNNILQMPKINHDVLQDLSVFQKEIKQLISYFQNNKNWIQYGQLKSEFMNDSQLPEYLDRSIEYNIIQSDQGRFRLNDFFINYEI